MLKQNCTDEEATEKDKLRKTVKEKCNEFMKHAKQRNLFDAGTFGEAWTMKLKGQSPLFVQKISRRVGTGSSIMSEVLVLSTFNIAYIPRLIYSGYTLDGKWCLLMEYFTGGTLLHHIKEEIKRKQQKVKPIIQIRHKQYIAYHLARAIEDLHKRKFTHGYA